MDTKKIAVWLGALAFSLAVWFTVIWVAAHAVA